METNGADIIAHKDNEKYVIQVKFYNNPVGNKAVQEVAGAIGMYKADKGIVVTNSTFTNSAIELAEANNIELVDGNKIDNYRKIISDNINYEEDDNISYINDILEIAESKVKDIDSTDIERIIANIGEAYVIKENFINYIDENKIQKFINGLLEYAYIGAGDEKIKFRDYENLVNIYARAGVYKYDIEKQVEPIMNNETLDEKEKHDMIQNLFEEYVSNNDEYNSSRYVALKLYFNVNLISEDEEEVIDDNWNIDNEENYTNLDEISDLEDLGDFDNLDDYENLDYLDDF